MANRYVNVFRSIILNGSSKRAVNNVLRSIPKNAPYLIVVGTTEKRLHSLKKKDSRTKAYYIYDPIDVKDRKIFDIECPKLELYDKFFSASDISGRL